MRFSVRFDAEQAERLELLATAFAERAQTTLVPLKEIARLWLADQAAAFDGGGPYGAHEPLTAGTLASKSRRGLPSTPLVASGVLMRSAAKRGAKGNLTRVTNDFFTGGTKNPVAHLQALGTQERVQKTTGRRTGRVPPRRFAAWTPGMQARAVVVLETYLTTGTVAAEGLADLGHAPASGDGLLNLDSL